MYSIEVNKLTKVFGKFVAVNGISFNVNQGEIFGFLGANGAGKSTAIRMLCGILEPTSGDAILGGYSVMNQPDKVKTQIGYMSQKFSLYNDLTVEENINFFGGVYGLYNHKLEERKKWVLKVAFLEGQKHLLTASLPGGIKQRLALAIAVIHEPKIVFLDEPTGGVDPISRRNFWDLINELSLSGVTVFVTTHYLDEAEFCNTITLINAGNIIASGSSKELKTKYLTNTILEVECDKVVSALDILSKQKWIDETSIFGNYIHINVKDENVGRILVKKVLTEQNSINISRLDKIVPTLEDVFIYLLEKDENKNAE
ncbi:MAG: ABC transporter ATP-binding protein [Ignavibacteriaceae bacterium]|nr:ABC transporter ATP-binding protein [Ignavibacteriaceae bacterium]